MRSRQYIVGIQTAWYFIAGCHPCLHRLQEVTGQCTQTSPITLRLSIRQLPIFRLVQL